MDKGTWKKRLQYFWDYQKWYVIMPLIIIFFLVTFISTYIEENKEPALCIAMVNSESGLDAGTLFTITYPEENGIDTEKTPIRLEYGLTHPKVVDEMVASNQSQMALIYQYQGILLNGTLDVTLATTWVVEEYEKADAYCDLRDILPKTYLEKMENRLFYCKNKDGQEVPVGIMVDDLKILGEFVEEGKPVFTVSAYSNRKTEAVEFIIWVIEHEEGLD